MKIGIQSFLTDEGIGPAALARAVEERGFESLWVPEHSHIPASRKTPYPFGGELPRVYYRALDPFVALSAAAAATETLVLGTSAVLLPQRDVIHAAKEVATLDLVSGGRFIFGVGIGWNREEMADHGVDPRTRGRLLDEQLAALQEIWTNEQAEFHGEFIDFDPMFSWPKPVQRPHPPIYIGGGSAAAVERAARHDGWLPIAVGHPDQVKPQLELAADRPDLPITMTTVGRRPALIEAYAEAGVERVALFLATQPYDETMQRLDELATLAKPYR